MTTTASLRLTLVATGVAALLGASSIAQAAGCSGTMNINNKTGHRITAAVQHFGCAGLCSGIATVCTPTGCVTGIGGDGAEINWKDMGMCQGYAITLIDQTTSYQNDCANVGIDATVTAVLVNGHIVCSKD